MTTLSRVTLTLLVAASAISGAGTMPLRAALETTEQTERQLLVVTGMVSRDDRAVLDPFLVLPAQGDAPAPPAGTEYAIDLVDAAGEVVSGVSFDLSFREEVRGAQTSRVVEIDETPFSVTLELPDGVETVRLRHGALVLAERTRTPNPPVIVITGIEPRDGELEVRWQGRDADGDPLTYSVSYAADGAAFESLAIDLETTVFRFDPAALRAPVAGRARLLVVASDGFNVGQGSYPVP